MMLMTRSGALTAQLSELRPSTWRAGVRGVRPAPGGPRGAEGWHGDGSEECVLVPYNDSPEARAATDAIADLEQAGHFRAWVLYVRPWFAERSGNRFTVESTQEARQCADAGAARLRRRGVPASAYVRDARRESIGHAIVAEARRLEVGRILLGTSGHSCLLSMLLGSITRQVARGDLGTIEVVRLPGVGLRAVENGSRRDR